MQLLDKRGGYLYEHRPDIIPQGYMTEEEVGLWVAFYERKNAEAKARG
jgi:hypothetical protein